MKKLLALSMAIALAGSIFAQSFATLQTEKTKAEVLINSDQKISFSSSLEGFYMDEVKTKDGIYSRIIVPEYFPDRKTGFPELPAMTKLIEVPLDAEFEIVITSYDEQVINLNDFGMSLPLVPNQASLFKNQDPNTVSFEKNNSIYQDLEYYSTELLSVELVSKMRGIQIAEITVSPFSYDIETNTLTIKNNIQAEIIYKNADLTKSSTLKANKYSPAFNSAYNSLWNYKAPATKDAISQYPIKYVIISDRMFEDALQPFIEWKTLKGFYVDIAYTDEIGATTTAIKAYIQGLYEAGTVEDPAPTFVLLVGDVAQIPSFNMSSHYSDMYYCEFDGGGDYVPEIYFGRFSATSVAQLQPQLEKTLMFEEYTFPDPAFLAEVVLVAGDDGTFGPTHANGQINYAHNYYFNEEHGVTTDHTYLYPAAGSSAPAIISDISEGAGFVNYTAHCGVTGWAGPSFTTTNIPSLANDGEYFFSIGNCCQSNTFFEAECFGEALLRADKKGAVAHIGGSNNTLWDEDFYWSCGVASSITATTTYEQTTQAAYDHMFHENGEAPFVSAYQINYAGNMSVMASTSSEDKYYWEIYHLMGDPSLMPYVGVPDEILASYLPTLPIGMSSLTVTTEPDAYVAISIDGVLLDAKLADGSGEAILEFAPLSTVVTATVVVTKQFRAPHIGEVMVIPNDNDFDAMLQSISVPSNLVHITAATCTPTVTILNLGQIDLVSVTVGYTLNGGTAVEIPWTGNLATLASDVVVFPEITLPAGENTIVAYVEGPNGESDEYTDNDEATKEVLVYSGEVKIISAETPVSIYCNNNMLTPQVTIKNMDAYPLTTAIISYDLPGYHQEYEWNGNLAENETALITFPENWFAAGNHTLTYNIESVNGGSNMASSGTSLGVDFTIIENGQMVVVDVLTDSYPEETTWQLVNNATTEVIYSAGPLAGANLHSITEMCLGEGCYTFTVFDSWGDGMSGSSWGNPADGQVIITNTSTSEEIMNFPGGGDWTEHVIEFCIIISDVDLSQGSIKNIYPNPTTGIVNFEFSDLINNIEVYNNLGQLVLNNKTSVDNASINLSNLPDGIYTIKVTTDNETITRKFVLEK
jgi:hypothetical protein